MSAQYLAYRVTKLGIVFKFEAQDRDTLEMKMDNHNLEQAANGFVPDDFVIFERCEYRQAITPDYDLPDYEDYPSR